MNDQSASDKWDDENYSIDIDCPCHVTHKAKLFIYGHKNAGLWQCNAGGHPIVEVCPHFDIEVEVTEDYEGAPDKIYICSLCRVAVEGDPVRDEKENYDD